MKRCHCCHSQSLKDEMSRVSKSALGCGASLPVAGAQCSLIPSGSHLSRQVCLTYSHYHYALLPSSPSIEQWRGRRLHEKVWIFPTQDGFLGCCCHCWFTKNDSQFIGALLLSAFLHISMYQTTSFRERYYVNLGILSVIAR